MASANLWRYCADSPLTQLDPSGRESFTLDFWEYRTKGNVIKEILVIAIEAEGKDLCSDEIEGKITVTMTLKEGKGWNDMRHVISGADHSLQELKKYGAFVFDGLSLPWDAGEKDEQMKKHPDSATAVKELKCNACPKGPQKGSNDIWLWGTQDWADRENTNISQIYRLEWSYECETKEVNGKPCCSQKTPFTAKVTLTGNDPGGNLKVPPGYKPPDDDDPWPAK